MVVPTDIKEIKRRRQLGFRLTLIIGRYKFIRPVYRRI